MVRKNKQTKSKSFYRSLVTFLVVVLLGIALVRVVMANVLATSGGQIAAANQKIKILGEENQKVQNEISKLESLRRVEKIAEKKGLIKSKNVEILEPQVPIANK